MPIIQDGGKVVNDSFAIAQYLERTYPDRPSLFGGPGGAAGLPLGPASPPFSASLPAGPACTRKCIVGFLLSRIRLQHKQTSDQGVTCRTTAVIKGVKSRPTERPGCWRAGEGAALFVMNWAMLGVVKPALQPLMILDIHGVLTDDDKAFFRKQREERFGSKLEEVRRARETFVADAAMPEAARCSTLLTLLSVRLC